MTYRYPENDTRPDRFSAAALLARLRVHLVDVGITLRATIVRWIRDDAASMAAAVAYYLALSVFPVLLVLVSGLGLFLRFTYLGQDAERQFLTIVAEHCSPALETQIGSLLEQLRKQSVISGPFGLLAAIGASIGVFYQFERAFDKIWRIPPPPFRGLVPAVARILKHRLMAFCMLLGVGAALAGILTANVALGILRVWMSHLQLPGTVLITLLDASATLVLNCLSFAVLYRMLPKRRVDWRDALRTGLLVAIMWEIGREFLCTTLIGMHSATTYGAIGSFIGLLLWFYYGVTILFFGAEYLQVLTQRRARPIRMFQPAESSNRVMPRRAA